MRGAFSLDARPGPAPGALRVRFSAGRLSPSQCSPVPVLGLPSALRHGTCPHFLRVSRRRCPSPAVLPKAAEAKILAGAGTSCGAAGVVGLEVPDCPKCSYQTPDTAARREASDRCHVSAPGRIATAQTAPPPAPGTRWRGAPGRQRWRAAGRWPLPSPGLCLTLSLHLGPWAI